ncbi:MAG: hypothetical protein IPM48_12685 [Saprospiraceae bacterium]|nr:hypothetical protein [Saprospiraceae bacterium]
MFSKCWLGLFCICALNTSAQQKIEFSFDTIRLINWPNIHSFSYGEWENEVYIFGGRKDGIHEKKSGFERQTNNFNLYIWNPSTQHIDSMDLRFLPDSLLDPLIAAATNFYQKDNFLLIIGGYGQNRLDSFLTYASLIVVDLAKAKKLSNWSDTSSRVIRQLIHPDFAIAGGQLIMINDAFLLVGGHQFYGIYDDNSGAIVQHYLNKASSFKLKFEGNDIIINDWFDLIDEFNFHRRDFNLVPFIFEDGILESMVFSGVFLVNENRPFLNIARLNSNRFVDIQDFRQLLANYHCAKLGIYERGANIMQQWFFGGMAEYFIDENAQVIQDPKVPFVKTVSSIVRLPDGSYFEKYQQTGLPGYFGTNSEIYILPHIKRTNESSKIIELDSIQTDSIDIAILFGGIYNPTTDPNPWSNNKASTTAANSYIVKIKLRKSIHNQTQSGNTRNEKFPIFNFYPQPAKENLFLDFADYGWKNISVCLIDQQGLQIQNYTFNAGDKLEIPLKDVKPGIITAYVLLDHQYPYSRKIVISN